MCKTAVFDTEDKPRLLPSSLREKRRYIIFTAISQQSVEYTELSGSIWRSLLEFLGELKTNELDIWIMKNLYDQKTQKGIIRCSPQHVENVRAALALVHQVGEIKAIIKVEAVTGTIKSAKKKYLGFTDLTDFSEG